MSSIAAQHPEPRCPVPVIGVIGGIGSGKSAVCRWVAERHPVQVIDADRLGHDVLDLPAVRERLRDAFGADIFDASGCVIRSELGRLVFGTSATHLAARQSLEQIVHPEIRRMIVEQLRTLDSQQYQAVLLDAAVLLESGWSAVCDAVVFIDTPVELRRERVAARGWSADDLARREASQWSLNLKRSAADSVLQNTGPLNETGEALWQFVRNQ